MLLAGFFAEQLRSKLGLNSIRLSPTLVQALKDYSWPGNVRELEHVIKRAGVLAKARTQSLDIELVEQDFDIKASNNQPTTEESGIPSSSFELSDAGLKQATDTFQKAMIIKALEQNQGNWAATARQLELDNGNLHRLAKRLGIK